VKKGRVRPALFREKKKKKTKAQLRMKLRSGKAWSRVRGCCHGGRGRKRKDVFQLSICRRKGEKEKQKRKP